MKPQPSTDPAALRRAAAARLKEKSATRPPQTEADLRRLEHELEVHQIELEMQNEELKASRAEVAKGLALYADLYDFAPTGYLTFDHEGVIRLVNFSGARLFGVERSRLVKRRFSQFVAESDRSVFRKFLQRVFASEAKESCEVTLPQEGSQPLVVQIEGTRSPGGQECRAVVLDITERRQAETELRQSKSFYQSLVESLPQNILRKDLHGRFTFANRQFCQSLGKTMDQILGKTDFDVFPQDLAAKYQRDDQLVIESGKPLDVIENYQAADGERRFVQVIKTPLRDPQGQVVGVQSIFWDITERKQADDQLRKLARAVDHSPVSIVITDKTGNIEFVNPRFTQVTGYTAQEVMGKNPRILKSGETPAEGYRRLWETLKAGKEWRGEFHNRRKDGTLFWEMAWISPVCDDAGEITHFIAVKEDTTEKKQMEANFLRAQRLESIGALAGGIAHDLNNILAPILMLAPLLRDTVPDPDSRAMLDNIANSAQRGADIIKQLLTFARGQPGVRAPLPVRHLLRDMGKIMRETFPRDIRPCVNTPNDIWPMLGDATQLHQALLNLCVNARDAMPDGGTLTVETRNVSVDEAFAAMMPDAHPGQYVCVGVADTGTGIASENLDRIFDPFFTTKDIGKGTGLGLATVLGIVRGHEGFVRVTSLLGQGTTFELYFPASPELHTLPTQVSQATRPRGQSELILVVDDEPAVCASLRRTLETHDYRVVTASQGAEGLAIFSEHPAEVRAVITDMMMPVMNGPTLVDALRAIAPQLLILGMTGLPEKNGLKGLEKLELSVLLIKPFSGDELLTVLHAKLQPSRTTSTRKGAE